MNGAFQIFNGFLFRRKRLLARVLIIGCLACSGNIAAAINGERQADGRVCVHLNLCIGRQLLILQIVGCFRCFIPILRDAINHSGLYRFRNHSYRNRLVCVVGDRRDYFIFPFH